jgi:hypothetical protein
MDDRDLFYVGEYHRRLIAISQQEQNLRQAKPARPGVRDYVLLHLGIYLINVGQRLRSASAYTYEKPVDLVQECA